MCMTPAREIPRHALCTSLSRIFYNERIFNSYNSTDAVLYFLFGHRDCVLFGEQDKA